MKMTRLFYLAVLLFGLLMPTTGWALKGPTTESPNAPVSNSSIDFRSNCDNAVSQFDQEINNVRSRLTTGGDVWWDGDDGRYVVPKPPPGVDEVSSIFAGAVWLGGRSPSGELKVAAQTYGRNRGAFDYYPGPLTVAGTIDADTCARWDRFWTVSGNNIREFLGKVAEADANGTFPIDPSEIPADILGWPGANNPHFFDINDFDLPTGNQGLAGYWDYDENGIYDPTGGDYPIIEIRGCVDPQFADEMTFWIYNDAGNNHNQSNTPTQIRMEVQVQAFAYRSSDDLNNMTFQRYKLINRAQEDLVDTYFAMWVDPDLGCAADDFVGCDTTRDLAYVYNEDALDGQNACTCDGGVATYCDEVPILGVDYFRGPIKPIFDNSTPPNQIGFEELGMSSFIYYNNGGIGDPPPGTTDPGTREEYYNYLQGIWRDGRPLETGGDGYDEGSLVTRFALPDAPDLDGGWSMCNADLPFGDRRTVQASGPFVLQPGAVNELIVGVPWVPNQSYPCPSLQRLQQADDIAQNLFDACFDILDGPDAPDLDWVELNREVIVLLSNTISSNNYKEEYEEEDPNIPPGQTDSTYNFEGYRIFQFASEDVGIADIGDTERVRIVAEFDVKNGIKRLFNWSALTSDEDGTPTIEDYFVPELQVLGKDEGIRHSLSITQDAFATDDTRLINHRRYYFSAIAYGYNNYKDFDQDDNNQGQRTTYLAGRNNIGENEADYYTVIPRPNLDKDLMASYGDMPAITRLAGKGNGGEFLELTQESRDEIAEVYRSGEEFKGEVSYIAGGGPLDVKIVNPREVQDGEYEILFEDDDLTDDEYGDVVTWTLRRTDASGFDPIVSEKPISEISEQLIPEYGFSVNIRNVSEPGLSLDEANGAIGGAISYDDPEGSQWLQLIPDGFSLPVNSVISTNLFNFVNTNFGEAFADLDPEQDLTDMFPGVGVYKLMDWRAGEQLPFFVSPVWRNTFNNIPNRQMDLEDLNNVDLVFTSDKSLWTRCPVIETRNDDFPFPASIDEDFADDGAPIMFDTRSANSVTREADADGLPIEDTDIDPDLARGMGWFPGYAIDVETGERLQVFWGENSVYDGREVTEGGPTLPRNGADMIFNPSSTLIEPIDGIPLDASVINYPVGGHHYVYVTKRAYDEGEYLEGRFEDRNASTPSRKSNGVREITYAMIPLLSNGEQLLSYADGLIPNDVTVKIRVNSQYEYAEGVEEFNGHGAYRFSIDGKMAGEIDEAGQQLALDQIGIVPNPYYGGSYYESGVFDKVVKITNLPARAVVTIYSLDGKFIRKYNRDEVETTVREGSLRPIGTRQISPALEWDLNNFKGIPVASGVYLIHVDAFEKGERTLKFFGVNRQFDPSGL